MNRSCEILQECIDVQNKKSIDYQNKASTVEQADYYLNGIQTIYDTMHGKMLRIKSIMETMLNDPKFTPNHESLRDSCIDLINYSSFFAAYLEGKIPGQNRHKNVFNRPNKKSDNNVVIDNNVMFEDAKYYGSGSRESGTA